jgi:hypothetical protein
MYTLKRSIDTIALSKPRVVEPSTAFGTTVERLSAWHDKVTHQIDHSSYHPELIFNMDETMVRAGSNKCKVFHIKDSMPKLIEEDGSENMHVTLALCVSAAGRLLKPFAILSLKNLPDNCHDLLTDYHWGYQSSGWMTKELFEKWVYR